MTYGVKRKQYKQQTIKIATEKQRSSREEEEKPTSNRLSNSSCNLVTNGVERKQYKLQTIKIAAKKQRSSREEKRKTDLK